MTKKEKIETMTKEEILVTIDLAAKLRDKHMKILPKGSQEIAQWFVEITLVISKARQVLQNLIEEEKDVRLKEESGKLQV